MTIDLVEKFKKFSEERAALDALGSNGRVLLVDSLNTYIRCFVATPTMNDEGEHVGGTIGFLKSVGMITRQLNPTRVVCVFDGAGGSLRRRKLYDGYKEKRRSMTKLNRTYDFLTLEEEQKSMKWQLQLLLEILSKLPVLTYAVDNIEADDTIAYLSGLIQERGGSCIIVSTDKDFLQLVSDTCHVYNPITKKMYTPDEVLSEYGIHPNNFLLYRMVEGDTSDNIPGVKGVGKATLIKNYPLLAESASQELSYLIDNIKSEKGKYRNESVRKIENAYNDGLLTRNSELMDLKNPQIAGTTKLDIIRQFDKEIPKLNKIDLTTLLAQFRLLSAFGNYNDWLFSSWSPLTRYTK